MDSILLYALPKTEPWTLERFLDEIKKACKEAANDLHRRSVMIEDAVEDLIGLALQVKKTRITKMIRLINVSTFYRLTPVSKPVNKRLVMLDLGQDTHKTQNTSKTPKTSCTSGTTYKTT